MRGLDHSKIRFPCLPGTVRDTELKDRLKRRPELSNVVVLVLWRERFNPRTRAVERVYHDADERLSNLTPLGKRTVKLFAEWKTPAALAEDRQAQLASEAARKKAATLKAASCAQDSASRKKAKLALVQLYVLVRLMHVQLALAQWAHTQLLLYTQLVLSQLALSQLARMQLVLVLVALVHLTLLQPVLVLVPLMLLASEAFALFSPRESEAGAAAKVEAAQPPVLRTPVLTTALPESSRRERAKARVAEVRGALGEVRDERLRFGQRSRLAELDSRLTRLERGLGRLEKKTKSDPALRLSQHKFDLALGSIEELAGEGKATRQPLARLAAERKA